MVLQCGLCCSHTPPTPYFYKKIMIPLPQFSKNINLWIREKFTRSSSSLLSSFDHWPWWTWLLLTISSIIAIPQVILFFVHLFFPTFLALFCSNFWVSCLLRHLCFLGKCSRQFPQIFSVIHLIRPTYSKTIFLNLFQMLAYMHLSVFSKVTEDAL